MTGAPGVAAVTAGPGVTNAITALQNAALAESPVVVFGGAAATLLRGRGALQDIDQLALLRPIAKWATSVKTLAQLRDAAARAFDVAASGVPGPVFVEVPVDLLYPEDVVRAWYFKESGTERPSGAGERALKLYLQGRLWRQFRAPKAPEALSRSPQPGARALPDEARFSTHVQRAAAVLRGAERPVLVVGSQALAARADADAIAEAVASIGAPTYLAGSARGLLGRRHEAQFRHGRSRALKEADVVVVAGFPFDFRLGYGRAIGKRATVVAANAGERALYQNRRPEIPVLGHPGSFLRELARELRGGKERWAPWLQTLAEREREREAEIEAQAREGAAAEPDGERGGVNPIALLRELEGAAADDAIFVADGGDFVATAAYVLRPRGPLCWLDPGAFGTLGVGGGFAVGAAAMNPGREIWLLYGDGSCAYSLAEFDTCARHGFAPIALIGNDASWAQIAREQVNVLGDDVGTALARTAYHSVAEGYGAVGLLLDDPNAIGETLRKAQSLARAGNPVVVNAHIRATDFRKGSISI